MGLGETAKLIASLELQDKMTPALKRASANLGKMETSMGRIGSAAQRGLGTAARNLAGIGVVAGAAIGAAVKSGIESLADLESAVASVDGAIEQMGLTVKGSQIAGWANEIETAIGAAFDDKDITRATATLIRFGKLTESNLRPAMEVMTDLAVKTGSVESAAELLGRALADPTKAAGKLSRSGVILTKTQQDTIDALVEANDVAGAQAYILGELAKTTKGAAAASQGPYKRAMSVLADVTEDAQKALAEGFLPVLMRASDLLSKAMGDPKVLANIRSFGQSLAGGLDSLISIAQTLPWSQIGQSLQLAGTGAKAVLGAFTSLPPWVQTAVLTGWGLNKLTGGALGGIAGELAKGLVKGVLGINAGVVNLRAGAVTGIPGGGTAAPVAGSAGRIGSIASAVSKVFMVGMAASAAAVLGGELAAQSKRISEQGTATLGAGRNWKGEASNEELVTAINGIEAKFRDPLSALALSITNPLNGAADKLVTLRNELKAQLAANQAKAAAGDERTGSRLASLNATLAAKNFSPTFRPQITVPVNVRTTVSVRAVTQQQRIVARYTGGRQTSRTIL